MPTSRKMFSAVIVALLASAGCTQDAIGPASDEGFTIVTSVVPAGGTTSVDPDGPIEIVFSHPMGEGMENYVALHEGDVTGPEVPGTWRFSDDRTSLTFTPDAPLESRTTYTTHLGGGMRDADGGPLGYEQCATQHGGQWATQQMMGNAMGNQSMMGPGWRHANGTYGMVFTFTTA